MMSRCDDIKVIFPKPLEGLLLTKYHPEDVCLLFRENGLKMHCQQVIKLGINGSDLSRLAKGNHPKMRIAKEEHRKLIAKVCKAVVLESERCKPTENELPATPSPVKGWDQSAGSIQRMQHFAAAGIYSEIASSLREGYRYSCSRSRSPSVRNLFDDRLMSTPSKSPPLIYPARSKSLNRQNVSLSPSKVTPPSKPVKTWAEKVAECTQSPCRRGLLSAALSAETTHCVNSKSELQKCTPKKPRKFGPEYHLPPRDSMAVSVLSGELAVEERKASPSPRSKNTSPGVGSPKSFGRASLAKRRVKDIGLAPRGEERKRIAMGWAAHN
eukprot:TRINITY_DN9438_c0_g1_i1.p1 TRINITY_DN9438_c0_g1~~TRINITY_DN9438_c0_g1_i1.p1  ORF type:complete len:326 (+),score=63.26 TRINITY_DN9438_c0_g1_i1:33-1010(+)